ncbi:MAG TPA: hypothetical protein VJT73_15920, partial [Polyangiaceae bacterium]|nr:hypothetical protein [Polyangiaceae bacterium]
YRSYLSRGGRAADVGDRLLPRAELAVAVKLGNVEAIEKYVAEHPNSHIKDEVSAALRQAMLVELEAKKRAGTVSALSEFSKKHPNNLVDPELRQAVHAVYQGAFATYKKESGVKDPAVVQFVEKLLAFAERAGPKVVVRFRRKASKSIDLADTQVKKSPYFMGAASLPSLYFDDAHARPRETNTAKTISDRFGNAFPADIVSFELGAPLTDSEAPLPVPTLPTLFIEHTAEVSGASYLSANPRGVFVGLGLLFEVTFRLPDETKPLKFRLSAWRPPDTTLPRADNTWEGAVYEAMATEGYAHFAQRYLATFFLKREAKVSD